MVMEVGQEDFIRSQMMAVYTIMIFQGWDWQICFQAINAHASVSNNVNLYMEQIFLKVPCTHSYCRLSGGCSFIRHLDAEMLATS